MHDQMYSFKKIIILIVFFAGIDLYLNYTFLVQFRLNLQRSLQIKKNDQKRVSSPGQAVVNGSSILVVGRPITTSPNPIKSIEEILSNIRENIESRN